MTRTQTALRPRGCVYNWHRRAVRPGRRGAGPAGAAGPQPQQHLVGGGVPRVRVCESKLVSVAPEGPCAHAPWGTW